MNDAIIVSTVAFGIINMIVMLTFILMYVVSDQTFRVMHYLICIYAETIVFHCVN